MKDSVPVMEHFYTLQGEGYWSGVPAYFVRLAGCDVGCVWCDVKESWDVAPEQWVPIAEIVQAVKASATERVVITGGEPAMYDLNPLTEALQAAGLKTHIETSGAHPFSGKFDWICLSPKKFKPCLPEWYALADELKVIVYNRADLEWGNSHADLCDPNKTRFYFQPEWSKRDKWVDEVIEYIKSHPRWRLSLQTHKYLNIP